MLSSKEYFLKTIQKIKRIYLCLNNLFIIFYIKDEAGLHQNI